MTVTVCVPVWNGASFVAETLECVRRQTHTDLRVLISVDNSDDDSVAVCRAFERDPRFAVAVQPERLGWVGNTNWLLKRVDTPFGCIMPHDDLITPDYLARLLARLERHPAAVLAYADMARFGLNEKRVVLPEVTGDRLNRIVTFLQRHVEAVAFRGVFRRRVLDRGHYLRQDAYQSHADASWLGPDASWLVALAAEGDLVRVPDVLYLKRIHGKSERTRRGLTPQSVVTRWIDQCAESYHVAQQCGEWTVTERQMIAAAALDRALSICGRPAGRRLWTTEPGALIAVASHYHLRVAGEIPLGTVPLDDRLLPPPSQAIWEQAPKQLEREAAHARREATRQARREVKKQEQRNAPGSAAVDSSVPAADGMV